MTEDVEDLVRKAMALSVADRLALLSLLQTTLGRVVHRREVHALVRVAPIEDSLQFEENERHLTGQHIGKRTVEDRGR